MFRRGEPGANVIIRGIGLFAEYFVPRRKRRIKSERIIEAIDQIMFDAPSEIDFANVSRRYVCHCI